VGFSGSGNDHAQPLLDADDDGAAQPPAAHVDADERAMSLFRLLFYGPGILILQFVAYFLCLPNGNQRMPIVRQLERTAHSIGVIVNQFTKTLAFASMTLPLALFINYGTLLAVYAYAGHSTHHFDHVVRVVYEFTFQLFRTIPVCIAECIHSSCGHACREIDIAMPTISLNPSKIDPTKWFSYLLDLGKIYSFDPRTETVRLYHVTAIENINIILTLIKTSVAMCTTALSLFKVVNPNIQFSDSAKWVMKSDDICEKMKCLIGHDDNASSKIRLRKVELRLRELELRLQPSEQNRHEPVDRHDSEDNQEEDSAPLLTTRSAPTAP